MSKLGAGLLDPGSPASCQRTHTPSMHPRAVDCIATRLWFDRELTTRCVGSRKTRWCCLPAAASPAAQGCSLPVSTVHCAASVSGRQVGTCSATSPRFRCVCPCPRSFPVNVLAGFEQDCGATYFNLSYLQVPHRRHSAVAPGCFAARPVVAHPLLSCSERRRMPTGSFTPSQAALHSLLPHQPVDRGAVLQDEYKGEPGTVIAADFYGASRLLPLSGERSPPSLRWPLPSPASTCWPSLALLWFISSRVHRPFSPTPLTQTRRL